MSPIPDPLASQPPAADPFPRALALWLPAAGRAELRSEALRPARPGEIAVRALFGAISRGTERLVFEGRVPESEAERMRGPAMAGDFAFPVKYGYAVVGMVEAGDDAWLGRTVFCLHPHQDRFVLPTALATPVPPPVPPARAVLTANMETALTILWDSGVQPGDRVAVFGAGVVGLLTGYLAARIPGTETWIFDPDPGRRTMVEALGARFETVPDGGIAAPPVRSEPFDVLINASGAPQALALAIDLAGHEARIVEASWHGTQPSTLALGGAFHARRLAIVSSQVGSLPPGKGARWTHDRRRAKALDLLDDPRLDRLITGETGFRDLAGAYGGILGDPGTLCHRIRYPSATGDIEPGARDGGPKPERAP